MNQQTNEKIQLTTLLEKVKSYTVSSLGKKRLDTLEPTANITVVKRRLNETAEGRTLLDAKLHMPFMGLGMIDHLVTQLEKGLVLDAGELIECADFLRSCRLIKQFMEKNDSLAPLLATYSQSMETFLLIEEDIYFSIKNGQIDSEASKELKKIRRLIAERESKIDERLNKFLKNKTNQPYIQEFFVSKKNERFTIPIKASYKNQVTGTIIETSSKGTTVFIEPTSVSKLNDEIFELKMAEATETYQILATLSGLILENLQSININLELIAEYDLIFARAKYSREINGITPKLNTEGYIHLIDAKHPLLGEAAIPLNFKVGKEYRGLVITGPNAGGKTVVLKTVGLLSLATAYGLQIDAKAGTEIALFDQIFVEIGDSQSLENALSTFSAHIKSIAEMMELAKPNSLLLFDEIGSGTEPNEGAALAIAILEEFYQRGCIVVATTHYGEIKRYSEEHPDFMNAAMAFNQDTITPLYQLIIGESGESNALWIAKKMKLKPSVIEQAHLYQTSKAYNVEKKSFSINKKSKEEDTIITKETVDFKKGDRVLLTEKQKAGLIYSYDEKQEKATVYIEGEMLEVLSKRLKLEIPATELYPMDYDLASLFVSYKERKEEHDIQRGSKKALKRIHKEIKKQQ
ncbi:mannonate oxidoreductase [Carnobacterium divergens]|uniref:endonuclease MutS2 n=1 Tax=Carnobacterium divergens TaxID=2748 RepID=UPI000E71D427|nr:endonuclease MutS2 [Carnobacterium divergens]ANZ99703.1 mannonate oxidoreductase [Carnobacterium divergens]MDT1995339.1 endonuclease MutS2 [Carnobacterium divergens]TFI68935.1 mannonate oxidoreductase [Carnobacterium divergens]TFI81407.1 mannonate oxidoreductase [Carnobacterium divergens]TFI88898.1 mannonate oxidoreductase [Carnobacterium divergens]